MFIRVENEEERRKLIQSCIDSNCHDCILSGFCNRIIADEDKSSIHLNPNLLQSMKQSGYFITKLIGNGYETSLIEKGDMNERDN
jgi:hypothetical protein